MNAFLCDFAHFTKTEYLKSTTISQDRTIPIHEFMQTARFTYNVMTWTQEQMIRITEYNLRIHLFQFFRAHGFYRGQCPYRHKCRCFDNAMWCMYTSKTSSGLFTCFNMFIRNRCCHSIFVFLPVYNILQT
ncbi:hypothetical protein D3C76_1178920 [compost metagenome]